MMRSRSIAVALAPVAGLIVFATLWEIAGRTAVLGKAWPALSSIFSAATSQRFSGLLLRSMGITGWEALRGYIIGIGVAALVSVVYILVRPLAGSISRFAMVVHALPPIVVGPLLLATVPRPEVPVVMAAMTVAFTIFVALSSGLESVSQAHSDLFKVLGASEPAYLFRLRLPSTVPFFVDGLKLAAPGALLGAILAEWFGAERGIGPILVAAMQNNQTDLLWAAALACVITSLIVFSLLTLLERTVRERFS